MKRAQQAGAAKEAVPAIENEAYWRKHYELHKTSGLSRVQYAKENHVHKDRFAYWSSKFSRANRPLVAIKVKENLLTTPVINGHGLCQLQLRNGCHLIIHDLSVLSLLLDRMG